MDRLKKENIAHLLRAIAAITQGRNFVIVGTGAVIARLKHVPLAMMNTRELDVYAETDDAEAISDLIDGSVGEHSVFDKTNGYYAHGVGERTACMPDDWKSRAGPIPIANHPDVTCLCPEPNDVAIAKACAWREKDRDWLVAGFTAGILHPDVMLSRIGRIRNDNAPKQEELAKRISSIRKAASRGSNGLASGNEPADCPGPERGIGASNDDPQERTQAAPDQPRKLAEDSDDEPEPAPNRTTEPPSTNDRPPQRRHRTKPRSRRTGGWER